MKGTFDVIWDFSPETLKRFAPGMYYPEQDASELYYLPDDFSQARNLAADNPDSMLALDKKLPSVYTKYKSQLSVLQGEFYCMGETKAKKPESRSSLSFVFVHSHDEHKQSPVFEQPAPWWSRFKLWVAYYSIQWRWDIERRLARLFKQRWGG